VQLDVVSHCAFLCGTTSYIKPSALPVRNAVGLAGTTSGRPIRSLMPLKLDCHHENREIAWFSLMPIASMPAVDAVFVSRPILFGVVYCLSEFLSVL
jgi:hypothetical protein